MTRGENRPSLRMLVAASRLREGQSIERVARVTRLPYALIELMAAELATRPPEGGDDRAAGA